MSISRRSFIALSAVPWVAGAQTGRRPLRRSDCFFGFHFDLHPTDRDPALGRDVSDEMVEHFLARTRPDYVQYDYKGHVGYVGYPSKVSASAPNVKNSLEIWRRITARNGVGLFIHFSGVLDGVAVTDHPEWARIGADGKRDHQQNSTFGPYVDQRMIPQLEEAIEKYNIDGAWVDGDCWGAKADYSPAAARAWREASGLEEMPKKAGDPHWRQFLDFNRQRFRTYLKHYLDTLHTFRPSVQIASNWMYTTFAPERPEIPVDFLSGDYAGNGSISTARLDARYLSSVGKPWDLMAWGFHHGSASGSVHKPACQLSQEASVVLAQGGGFQIYYQPTRAGKLDDHLIGTMAKVASFCRARQSLSHKSETVPQIGVVFSKNSVYETGVFGPWGATLNPARGMLDALVESHYSVDVVPDWKLPEVAAQYPALALPDWADIGPGLKSALAGYVGKGGNLLLAGAANTALFAKELGVRLTGEAAKKTAYVIGEETFASMSGLWQEVDPAGAEAIESCYDTYDSTRDAHCAATLSRFGTGRIAAIYGPAGTAFAQAHASSVRQFIGRVAGRIFSPMLTLEAPATVEATLRRKQGKLLLHLGNCTAMQVAGDYATVDAVPPVGPLRISLRTPGKPAQVTLEPEGRVLVGTWRNGVWTGTLDKLDIHAIVAFSMA